MARVRQKPVIPAHSAFRWSQYGTNTHNVAEDDDRDNVHHWDMDAVGTHSHWHNHCPIFEILCDIYICVQMFCDFDNQWSFDCDKHNEKL